MDPDRRDRPGIGRRDWLAAGAACGLGWGHARAAPAEAPAGTLRVAFDTAEVGFDPVQVSDYNTAFVIACIFESLLTYDYLALPVQLKPQTAVALPEISDDHRSFTFRLRPGIHFADDPAFGGRPRELTAQDYVYTIKRHYDPRLKGENLYIFENAGLLGLSELREQAMRSGDPFDYGREVEGLRALDRYTLRVKLATPDPRFHHQFANPLYTGALAREVVEAYGGDLSAHPVGTGPFRLGSWRRASRIELLRNPGFREQRFEAQPAPGDAAAQALARELAGRRLPLVERVQIDVIDEDQPRWLAFLDGSLDQLELPYAFAPVALSGNEAAPHLARRGVRVQRTPQSDMAMTYFNFDDPLVGGYTPEKVALRRAVGLARDGESAVRLQRNGQGFVAQSTVAPFTVGYEPAYRSEMSQYDPARARALLDLYGYLDRDGDGWREQPDGRPLTLRLASASSQRSRRANEAWRSDLAAVGLRIDFEIATWPDLLKKSRAGALMMWGYTWVSTTPDGGFYLGIAYGPNARTSNDAHFALPAFDALFRRQNVLPDGPQRLALMRDAKNLMVAYMPYKAHAHSITNDLLQPRVGGFRRHPFLRDLWRYTSVDRVG